MVVFHKWRFQQIYDVKVVKTKRDNSNYDNQYTKNIQQNKVLKKKMKKEDPILVALIKFATLGNQFL